MASKTLEEVAEYMKKLHFRKGLFGIKPASLWKKLEDLDSEYRSVFYVQEISFESRLKERGEEIAELKKRISALEALLPENQRSLIQEATSETEATPSIEHKGESENG